MVRTSSFSQSASILSFAAITQLLDAP